MIKKIILHLLSIYQRYIRVALPPACRFVPSCSEYAKEAVSRYGPAKGLILAAQRLMHCHPFGSKSGYDPLL